MEREFFPRMSEDKRRKLVVGWERAVSRSKSWASPNRRENRLIKEMVRDFHSANLSLLAIRVNSFKIHPDRGKIEGAPIFKVRLGGVFLL